MAALKEQPESKTSTRLYYQETHTGSRFWCQFALQINIKVYIGNEVYWPDDWEATIHIHQ